MAKKKKTKKSKDKKKKEKKEGVLSSLKRDTTEGIVAILFILISIVLFMAAWGQAGIVGEKIYSLLKALFGVGYYLLPLILLMLGISFLAQLSRNWATLKIIGSFILFFSGIGLVDLLTKKGGIVGALISNPLVKLFEFWVSLLLLLALSIISILIIFDASLRLSFIRRWLGKDEEIEDDLNISGAELEDEEDEYGEEDIDVPVTAPPPDKPVSKEAGGLIFFNRRSKGEFTPPPLSLLEKDSGKPGVGDVKANANIIKRTLLNFGIQVEMDEVSIGPSVTRYALKPAEGVKLARIVALQKDLSLALAAHPIRIEAPIPGKSLVGIEIPNSTKTLVGLGTLLKNDEFQNSSNPLTVCLGKGITGLSSFANLAKMPHVLIAGATGSGKSVTIHTVITSLLYRNPPENLKFIMVDPKRVELTLYNKIPHLLTPVITNAKKAILALKWAAKEMDRRYDILEENSVRDIQSYHQNVLGKAVKKDVADEDLPDQMPYIVIVIDELADIMQAYPRELESAIVRLAQMSRAVGIHLILSTQRPSVNVITGLIKANIPARAALQVSSQIDSRTILDMPGAEKLLGAGDMLYLSGEMSQPRRLQSAFISEKEVKNVVKWLAKNYEDDLPEPELNLDGEKERTDIFDSMDSSGGGGEEDELYEEAKQIVIEAGKASTSYIQRKLRVGYARAARLIDILEEKGIVGPADGSKPREILIGGEGPTLESPEGPGDEYEEE